eukprot:2461_1
MKQIQRFCIDIKPIHAQYNNNNNNMKNIIEYIGKHLRTKNEIENEQKVQDEDILTIIKREKGDLFDAKASDFNSKHIKRIWTGGLQYFTFKTIRNMQPT